MITLITDTKIIKAMRDTYKDDSDDSVAGVNVWLYNSPCFINLSYDKDGYPTPQFQLMSYFNCTSYKDFLKLFNIEKSSFVVDTYRRYKHYALKFEHNNEVYYFSLSHNKDRGMDLMNYPTLSNIDIDTTPNTASYLKYEPVMYNFCRELFSDILTYLFTNYDLETIKDGFKHYPKTHIILDQYYKDRDFSIIMPAI